ncbi:radical SAM protein [Candidatus Desantisbacteria bacterium]|nr:radical SAM protein [Candidatus Desantisbacteria bacterium]
MFLDFNRKENIAKGLLFRNNEQKSLFEYAQKIRDEVFSKQVEVRSVIEYSNICGQACNYCGMNRFSKLKRYILSDDELLKHIDKLYSIGRRVIMIQTGEFHSDVYFNRLYELLRNIKNKYTDLSLVCSFGCLSEHKYKKLRDIGIERYLLKFETSNSKLYKKAKPSSSLKNKLAHIKILKKYGFMVSSGNITGLPGQTPDSLINDLLLLKKLDIPMGSTSVFIPNDMSIYANYPPGDIHTTLNFMAILRIMCPFMLIPTTSSLELVIKDGQYLGLMAGANVVTLHDGTPGKDENNFIIYKKDRYKPKDDLLKTVARANLIASSIIPQGYSFSSKN